MGNYQYIADCFRFVRLRAVVAGQSRSQQNSRLAKDASQQCASKAWRKALKSWPAAWIPNPGLSAGPVSRIRDSKKRNACRRKLDMSRGLRLARQLWQIAIAP